MTVQTVEVNSPASGLYTWATLQGAVGPVALTATRDPSTGVCTGLQVVPPPSANGPFNGLRWIRGKVPTSAWEEGLFLQVMVQGDFIVGTATNPDGTTAPPAPVDGNHLAPFLSGGRISGDGTTGGLFQSWMALGRSQARVIAMFTGGTK
jgi:hypothetical protein